jgi:hypothetical protein
MGNYESAPIYKMFFDIESTKVMSHPDFLETVKEVIVNGVNKYTNTQITADELLIFSSSNIEKFSAHIIIPKVRFCNIESMKVLGNLIKYNCEDVDVKKAIDHQVWRKKAGLRIYGSTKSNRTKKLLEGCKVDKLEDCFVSYFDHSIISFPETFINREFIPKEDSKKKTKRTCKEEGTSSTVELTKDVVSELLEREEIQNIVGKNHKLRYVDGDRILFYRKHASECRCCDGHKHDNDNTLYFEIREGKVFEGCFRSTNSHYVCDL